MKQTAVTAMIILPMVKLYHPPYHHKGKSEDEIGSIASETYGDALKGFPREVLAAAWKRVVSDHKTWGWPAVGEITKACREIMDSAPVTQFSPGQEKKFAWEIAADKAQSLRDEFMANCGDLPLSRQAKRENWYFGLKGLHAYFNAHATMQAQVIADMRNHAYQPWTVGYGSWIDDTNYNFNGDVATEKSQARQRGEIQIEVSQLAIDWMIKHSANIR